MSVVRPSGSRRRQAPRPSDETASLRGRHVVFLSWRDTRNPEGGGAELYLERMAEGLVARGCSVTIFSAAHDAGPADEVCDGIRYVRRGTKTTVYLEGVKALRRGDLGEPDLVVDVQNGLPFFSRRGTKAPVVVLVHHVHREQWPVVYPGLVGKVGWWIERRLAPWYYRRCQYVAVSSATRAELAQHGVGSDRVAVVHNGTDPVVTLAPGASPTPMLATVGRLVPHKQVEHAIDVAVALRAEHPDLRLHVVGGGWWEDELRAHAAAVGAGDTVVFEGHVDEARKHQVYEQSWLHLMPSLKEGWGLVIGEAGMHGTPTIAYASAGGVCESIDDGRSGLLVDDPQQLLEATRGLLADATERARLADGARVMSHAYSWESAQRSFAEVMTAALEGVVVGDQHPIERDAVPTPAGRSRRDDTQRPDWSRAG
ncbi:glycosyltransferase family 4 protein [Nocardioides sp.]|uniref:glycosyltransferase family 4 protein n=1 Tax=Nocardioides sp. TaxID=35761 RepID=UPI0027253A27|nr:glycosyltransferase family 4 protein [Nocardioides sp.]MDO9455307.1 glycosyltransferase family 4 protein [Nocardioides sp.]